MLMLIQNFTQSSNSLSLRFDGNGNLPKLHSFADLDIRMPPMSTSMQFADEGKSAKASYGNPALAQQPKPNVMILINNREDTVAINGTHINAPHRTLVIVAHGGPSGVQQADGTGNYQASELANLVKQNAGKAFSQYDHVVFVSCRVALAGNDGEKPNGKYMQQVANVLGKPVYAASEFGYVHPSGKITVAGSTSPTNGQRKTDAADLGRFIRFDPGAKVQNSAALQVALREHGRADENKPGAGAKVDDEFSGKLKSGRCVNATVAQCIGK
jgi:hypothetical protein